MTHEKLFTALQDVCNFTALESDMFEIERAIITDQNSEIRKLLHTILAISEHDMIHDAINEFLNDYEYPNKW